MIQFNLLIFKLIFLIPSIQIDLTGFIKNFIYEIKSYHFKNYEIILNCLLIVECIWKKINKQLKQKGWKFCMH